MALVSLASPRIGAGSPDRNERQGQSMLGATAQPGYGPSVRHVGGSRECQSSGPRDLPASERPTSHLEASTEVSRGYSSGSCAQYEAEAPAADVDDPPRGAGTTWLRWHAYGIPRRPADDPAIVAGDSPQRGDGELSGRGREHSGSAGSEFTHGQHGTDVLPLEGRLKPLGR